MLYKVEILDNDSFLTRNFISRVDAIEFINDFFFSNNFTEENFPFVALYCSSVDIFSYDDYFSCNDFNDI